MDCGWPLSLVNLAIAGNNVDTFHNLVCAAPLACGDLFFPTVATGAHMIECTFELNDKPMSALKIGALSVPAFSGQDWYTNRKTAVCTVKLGAIPPGRYYILDRESGGLLGPLRDLWNKKKDWFSLYADDGKVDDVTYCELVKRGQFRLHPKGLGGVSEGCITIENEADFYRIRAILKGTQQAPIPGTPLKTYGRVLVK